MTTDRHWPQSWLPRSGSTTPAPIEASEPAPPRPARLWMLAMAAAVLAGLATWMIGEGTVGFFEPPPRLVRARGFTLNRPSFKSRVTTDFKNATLSFVVFGAGLGLAMGLAGGLGRQAPRLALMAAVSGLFLGGVAAGMASAAVLPFYYRRLDLAHETLSHDLVLPFLVHAGVWSSVGATAGVAYGIGLRARQRLALVAFRGLVGGLLGAAIYEVVGALFFPVGRTGEPLAGAAAPRLIGHLTVAIGSAAFFVPTALAPYRQPRQPVADRNAVSEDPVGGQSFPR